MENACCSCKADALTAQGFALNATSGSIVHLSLGHGKMKPSMQCLRVTAESMKVGAVACSCRLNNPGGQSLCCSCRLNTLTQEAPKLGPFVSSATCYDGGSGTSRAGVSATKRFPRFPAARRSSVCRSVCPSAPLPCCPLPLPAQLLTMPNL